MKKLFMAAVAVLSLVACTSKAQYVVEGTSSKEGVTVYLHDALSSELLDQTQVTDGQFSFTGKQDKNALLIVSVDEDTAPNYRFFNDGVDVAVDMDAQTLCGSELNQRLSDYDTELHSLEVKMLDAYVALQGVEDKDRIAELLPAFQATQEEFIAYPQMILEDNPDNIIPAAFMEYLVFILEPDEFTEALDSKAPYMKHPLVKKAVEENTERAEEQAEADAIRNDIIGKEFIDFEMTDEDDNIHALSQFVGRGNWVLIDFWASWCAPCRAELPNVVRLYNKYKDKGFDIYSVSLDKDRNAWLQAIQNTGQVWPNHVSDLQGWTSSGGRAYGVSSIPHTVLIDAKGRIIGKKLRGEELANKLQEIFGE